MSRSDKPRAYALYDGISGLEGIDPVDKCLLFIMATHADAIGQCAYPGVARLAKRLNRSEATVMRSLKRLCAMGFLIPAGKHGYTDRYHLQIPGVTPVYNQDIDTGHNISAISREQDQTSEQDATMLEQAFETSPVAVGQAMHHISGALVQPISGQLSPIIEMSAAGPRGKMAESFALPASGANDMIVSAPAPQPEYAPDPRDVWLQRYLYIRIMKESGKTTEAGIESTCRRYGIEYAEFTELCKESWQELISRWQIRDMGEVEWLAATPANRWGFTFFSQAPELEPDSEDETTTQQLPF